MRHQIDQAVELAHPIAEVLQQPLAQAHRLALQWLSDNGSPCVAADTRRFARELGLVPVTTPIESPQSNGMVEAFVNTLRRDYVSVNPTPDAPTILASLPRWIEHYNKHHPHSSLRMRSPRMFRHERTLAE